MGKSSTPTPITIQGRDAGQLYHYNDFNQGSGIVTTHHSIVNNEGSSGAPSIWSFAPSSGSSMSGGTTSTPSQQSSSGLSFQFASNAAIGSSGSVSAFGGGSGGGSSSGGSSSSASGFAMFAVGFPQSNLVTAVNSNQTNSAPTPPGTYDDNGWLPDPGEPMPIGDGTWPMLFFAVGYAARQYRKIKKEQSQTEKL